MKVIDTMLFYHCAQQSLNTHIASDAVHTIYP